MIKDYTCPNKERCQYDYKKCSWGFKGANADSTKLLIVAHRPDDRVDLSINSEPDLFGEADSNNHETEFRASATGQQIGTMLKHSGLTLEDICFTNIFWGIANRKKDPSYEEYQLCKPNHHELIEGFQPRAMIVFGKKPYATLFEAESKQTPIQKEQGIELPYRSGKIEIPSILFTHPCKIRYAVKNSVKPKLYQQLREFLQGHNII